MSRKKKEWKPLLTEEQIEELRERLEETLNNWLHDHVYAPPDLRRIATEIESIAEACDERGAEWAMSVGPDE